jgi:hypothetical protein
MRLHADFKPLVVPAVAVEDTMNKSIAKNFPSRPRVARAVLMAGALLALGLAQSAKADYIYTYTGNAFTYWTEGFDATNVSGSITLASPLPPDTVLDLTPPASPILPTGFEFTDGEFTMRSGTPFLVLDGSFLATGSTGSIIHWCVCLSGSAASLATSWILPDQAYLCGSAVRANQDFSYQYKSPTEPQGFQAGNLDSPGTWTESESGPAGVPEPTTIGLTALGGAILLLARRRQRQNHRATRRDRTPPANWACGAWRSCVGWLFREPKIELPNIRGARTWAEFSSQF